MAQPRVRQTPQCPTGKGPKPRQAEGRMGSAPSIGLILTFRKGRSPLLRMVPMWAAPADRAEFQL